MKKIVVLGAGFAGIKTVVALQKKLRGEAEIILVDRNPYHYETIRLFEVATGAIPYTKMSYEVADVIKPNVTTFIQDEVRKINFRTKTVELGNHAPIKYDYCVVGLGFTLNTMGIAGAEENALPMHNVKDAEAIRDHIYANMKAYRESKDPKNLHIIVCGAGFQAVELANGMSVARPRFAKMAGVKPEDIKITMIDGSPRLLPMLSDKQLEYAMNVIKKNGIEIIHPARVTKVFSDMVYYQKKDQDEEKLEGRNIIWMMGFSGSPVVVASGFKERRGRVMVTDRLTSPESEDVYFLGDVSSVMIPGKTWPWPNTGQLALSMANYAAKDIMARLNGFSRPTKYEYNDLGVVIALGEDKASGNAMGVKINGFPASVMKKIIIDKSVLETGGLKETFAIGRFDFFH